MKFSLVTAIIVAFVFTGQSLNASETQHTENIVTEQATESMSLLLPTPSIPVGEVFDLSTTLS